MRVHEWTRHSADIDELFQVLAYEHLRLLITGLRLRQLGLYIFFGNINNCKRFDQSQQAIQVLTLVEGAYMRCIALNKSSRWA